MRFRQRFSWAQVFTAAVWLLLSYFWIRKHRTNLGIRSTGEITGLIWCFLLLFNYISYFLIWWDLDQNGLRERRLFSVKTVPWRELVRVGPWNKANIKNRQFIEAEYRRSAPLSDSGKLLLRVRDDERKELFRRLQSYAPQAQIDVF